MVASSWNENSSDTSSTDDDDDFRYCDGDASSTDDDDGYGSAEEYPGSADKIWQWQNGASAAMITDQHQPSSASSTRTQKSSPPAPAPSLTVRDLLAEQALHKNEAQLKQWLLLLRQEENGVETTQALLAVDRADLVGCSAVLKAAIARVQGATGAERAQLGAAAAAPGGGRRRRRSPAAAAAATAGAIVYR